MGDYYIRIPAEHFKEAEWKLFYPEAHEELPPDMRKSKGKSVKMTCFIDINHTGDKITQRSYTGIVILLNNAPIM